MEINYDKDADAIYIKLCESNFVRNKKLDDDIILDIGENDEIIGIEIIDASKRIPKNSLSKILVKNLIIEQ